MCEQGEKGGGGETKSKVGTFYDSLLTWQLIAVSDKLCERKFIKVMAINMSHKSKISRCRVKTQEPRHEANRPYRTCESGLTN